MGLKLFLILSFCGALVRCSNIFDNIPIGGVCTATEDCVGQPRSRCSESTKLCECVFGYLPKTDKSDCLEIATKLGVECEQSDQCTQGMPGDFSDCLPSDTVPLKKECKCKPEEAVGDPLGLKCYKTAEHVDDLCELNVQCTSGLGELSQCEEAPAPGVTDKTCVCSSDGVASEDKTKCLPGGLLIDDPCEEHVQCVGAGAGSGFCKDQKCQCLSTHVAKQDRAGCLPIRNQLEESCEENQQCTSGTPGPLSSCSLTKCQCTWEAVHASGGHTCHKKATLVGDPCDIDEQCRVILATCFKNQTVNACICNAATHVPTPDLKQCVPKRNLGESCTSSVQCEWIGNATCSEPTEGNPGKCQCDGDSIQDPTLPKCYKLAKQLGDSCHMAANECANLTASICHPSSRTCECPEDRVGSSDKTQCLPKAGGLNQTCTESGQCPPGSNSECIVVKADEKECRCRPNEYVESWETKGTCVQIVNELNLPCSEQVQCKAGLGNLSECSVAGFCQCGYDYGFYAGKCYTKARLGWVCHAHEECYVGVSEFALCANLTIGDGRCRCANGAEEYAGKCYGPKSIGDGCRNTEECDVVIEGDVKCDPASSTCKCGAGSSPELGGKLCVSGGEGLVAAKMFMLSIVMGLVLKLLSY